MTLQTKNSYEPEEAVTPVLNADDKRALTSDSEIAFLTPNEHRLCVFVFILMGTSALYFWNSVISTMFTIIYARFPEASRMSDTIFATYCTLAFVSTVLLYIVVPTRPIYNLAGGGLLCIMTILYPATALYSSPTTAKVMLHLVAGLAGCSEMLFQMSGFAFAVILNGSYGAWVSFGYGVCGVLSFCLWLLCSRAIFPNNLSGKVWLHFGLAALILLLAMGAFQMLLRRPFMIEAIARSRQAREGPSNSFTPNSVAQKEDDVKESKPIPESVFASCWRVIQYTWFFQITFAILIGSTMMVFPSIGPMQWHNNNKRTDVLTGMFQIGEFIGRCIPSLALLSDRFSFVMIPRWLLYPLTYLRLVLLALCIVVAKYAAEERKSVLTKYGAEVVLMLVLSLTNGWYASVFMARVSDGLKLTKDRARASAMAVCLLILSITVGLWLAKTVNFS